ncbi:MAG: polysaccharide pyruvyl transferase family protein [Pseudomonadales bacterium]|nr:polysaccharide pyruvyl transferase family protein [Pseudomonadales bacterium]
MKKKLFIFNIATAYDNQGDLLINRALVQNLRKFGTVRASSQYTPEWFLAAIGIKKEEIGASLFSIIKSNFFRNKIYLVSVPGHNFGGTKNNIASAAGLLKIIVARLLFGIKFIKIGTSFGSASKTFRALEAYKSFFCTIYGVRDTASLSDSLPSRITYYPDLAFTAADLNHRTFATENYIYISFREKIPERATRNGFLNHLMAQITQHIISANYERAVVAFQVPVDKAFCRQIAEKLKTETNLEIEFKSTVLSFEDSIAAIGKARCVLSNRLHVLLPSLIMGVPLLAITDTQAHTKVTSLLTTIDATFTIFDVFEEGPLQLDPRNTKNHLLEIASKQRRIAQQKLEEALKNRL